MDAKKKKQIAIVAMIGTFILIVWWLAHKKTVAPSAVAPTPDAQDSYYASYNMPPIAMPGTANVQPSHIDLGNTSNNFGPSQADLDALGNKICGCMNPCSGSAPPFSGNMGNMFDTSLIIPEMPQYLQNYVAPVIPELDVGPSLNVVAPPPAEIAPVQHGGYLDRATQIFNKAAYNPNIQQDEIYRERARQNKAELEASQAMWAI